MARRMIWMSSKAPLRMFQRISLWLLVPCCNLLGLCPSESAKASGFIFAKLPASSNSCPEAQASISRKLKAKGYFSPYYTRHPSGQKITISPSITISDDTVLNGYHDFPEGYPVERSQALSFNVTGDFISLYQGLLSSPQYLTTLAAEILASCPSVGQVAFSHW